MRARGRSMFPTICNGDWVFVDASVPVRAGEIAVFGRGETAVVHRVVSVRRGLEMGDACRHANRFERDEVVGRVVALTRAGETIDLTTMSSRFRGRLRWVWDLRWLGLRMLERFVRKAMSLVCGGLGSIGSRETR